MKTGKRANQVIFEHRLQTFTDWVKAYRHLAPRAASSYLKIATTWLLFELGRPYMEGVVEKLEWHEDAFEKDLQIFTEWAKAYRQLAPRDASRYLKSSTMGLIFRLATHYKEGVVEKSGWYEWPEE